MPPPAEQLSSPLPYTDTKPVGAADFYAAVNATFRFIGKRFGLEGLHRYWTDMGQQYHAPVSERWRAGGLTAVAEHWRAFFSAEPGAVVAVTGQPEEVIVTVQTCPAIKFLRDHQREIVPEFCQHCYFVSASMGAAAGIDVRIAGGNGACTQHFAAIGHFAAPQRLEDIATAASPCHGDLTNNAP